MKGWYGNKMGHKLASKGVRTKANGIPKNWRDKYDELSIEVASLSDKVLIPNWFLPEHIEEMMGRPLTEEEYLDIVYIWGRFRGYDYISEEVYEWFIANKEDIEEYLEDKKDVYKSNGNFEAGGKNKKWILEHPETGGTVGDKLFNSEDEAIRWWEENSRKYPEEMEVELKKIRG